MPVDVPGTYWIPSLVPYGWVEEFTPLRGESGIVNGDYTFHLCLKMEGFQVILDTIQFRNQQMVVVVEGQRPHCWLWHLGRAFPQKIVETNRSAKKAAKREPRCAQNPSANQNQEKRWTEVVMKDWKSHSSEASHRKKTPHFVHQKERPSYTSIPTP